MPSKLNSAKQGASSQKKKSRSLKKKHSLLSHVSRVDDDSGAQNNNEIEIDREHEDGVTDEQHEQQLDAGSPLHDDEDGDGDFQTQQPHGDASGDDSEDGTEDQAAIMKANVMSVMRSRREPPILSVPALKSVSWPHE